MLSKNNLFLSFLSALILIFSSGCGSDTKQAATAQATPAQTTTTSSTTVQADKQKESSTPAVEESKQEVATTPPSPPLEQQKQTEVKPAPIPVKEKPEVKQASVEIISVSSPAPRNSTATLKAKVPPGATASITVHYKSGPSKAAGLESKNADANGYVSWSWHVGGNTTLGSWPITVSSGGASAQTEFQVVH